MKKGTNDAKDDFTMAEVFSTELGAMEQPHHGQIGICNMVQIMIVSITGFVPRKTPFVKINGKPENPLDRFRIK